MRFDDFDYTEILLSRYGAAPTILRQAVLIKFPVTRRNFENEELLLHRVAKSRCYI